MACYWDTSALLSLLFPEEGSSRARRLARERSGLPGYTSFFTFIEMESAFARRLAEGVLEPADLSGLRLRAQRLESALGVIWPDADLMREARRLVPEMGLRPGDALQLASARLVSGGAEPVAFASFDDRLNDSARAAGLTLPW